MGSSDERRRTPRFPCAGEAKIIRLPSEGLIVPGRLRDLSLGGCCLETPARIDSGARAEIVLRVNSAIFRAISQVRAIRGRFALGLEFLRLSLAGREELRETIDRLARLHVHLNRMTTARLEEQREFLLREMEREELRRHLARFPLPGIAPSEASPRMPVPESPRPTRDLKDLGDDDVLDIFV